jgi:hypothetical protein
MATKSDGYQLSPGQEIAIAALVRGTSVTIAAEEAGVARQTVSGWRNSDPAFIAAVNCARREVWEQEQDRVRSIRTRALEVIAAELDGDDAFGMALDVLKVLARMDVRPTGSTTPERVAQDQAFERLTMLV